MEPMTMMLIASAIASGAKAAGGAISAKSAGKKSEQQAALDRALERELSTKSLAATESMSDPFRHTLDQFTTAEALDRMQNTRQKTVSIPGLDPRFMPKLGGGYQASNELRSAAGMGRSAVLAGQGQAPTMTDPANYGKTGAIDWFAKSMDRPDNPLAQPAAGPMSPGLAAAAGRGTTTRPGSGMPSTAATVNAATPSLLDQLKAAGLIPPGAGTAPTDGSSSAVRAATQRGIVRKQPTADRFALSF